MFVQIMVGYKAGKKTSKRKKAMEREKQRLEKEMAKKRSNRFC